MLAPRKKLWSTPPSAVDHLVEHIPLRQNDVVLDIGCGDGRILLQWAERVSKDMMMDENDNLTSQDDASTISFLGIDIDADRIQQCRTAARQAQADGRIHPNIHLEFMCANALQSADHFQNATVIFMYLIPRGLNLITPLLMQHIQKMHCASNNDANTTVIRVATYMSKLPQDLAGPPKRTTYCQVPHQPDAAWPLYFYEFSSKGT